MRSKVFRAVCAAAACFALGAPAPASAQQRQHIARNIAANAFWTAADSAQSLPDRALNPLTSHLTDYRAYQLDSAALLAALRTAPMEFSMDIRQSPLVIALPLPDGTLSRFAVLESPIVSPDIAAAHPELKTYIGQGVDNPAATARFDHTPDGFHAMIITPGEQIFIDPYNRGEAVRYISYSRAAVIADSAAVCETQGLFPPRENAPAARLLSAAASVGTKLRQYRLALSCTAEYAAVFGGTTAGAMNAMTTTVNRIDGIYETEFAIRLSVVKFNIYTTVAGEPFTNGNAVTMLPQNEAVCDGPNTANTGPGTTGYDVAQVFSTAPGGVSYIGVVCLAGYKGQGVSGNPAPNNIFFDLLAAHEIGHEFGANHTFNGTSGACGGSRSAMSAYEPGSGSTIMAYSGICPPENVQQNSSSYFHTRTFDEVTAYVAGQQGGGCSVQTGTGNNPPTVSPGAAYTIPQGTPFTLTAAGSDSDGDSITYCWEEFDLGAATPPTNTGGDAPFFRSYPPVSSPARTFPRLSDLLANAATPWEVLPTVNRTLNFRVTVRDNKAGGGGVNYAAVPIAVNGATFALANRASTFTWNTGTAQTVTWTVGGGSVASNVNILLSTDGGTTFTTLAANVPNTGSATITVPPAVTTQGRLRIEAVGNIFFDVSRVNFTIAASPPVTVSGTLHFTGIVSAAPVQSVTFVFQPIGGGTTTTQTVSVPASGVFGLGSIPRGNYNLWIKGGKYLAVVVPVNAGAGNVSGVTATLPAGDANNDNKVDLTDFGLLVNAFGSTSSGSGSTYDSRTDFNGDGMVDLTDFGLLVNSFGNFGAP